MTLRVLAIDTSTPVAAVAVLHGTNVLAEADAPDIARHDHMLLPRVHAALEASALTLSGLDLLAVGLGPGAFGGLRVGLATIKGLAIATSLPTVGVNSLEALGHSASTDSQLVLTLQDAHRGELFAAMYRRDGEQLVEQLAPCMGAPGELAMMLQRLCTTVPELVGDGFAAHRDALLSAWPALASATHCPDTFPRARHVGLIAARRFELRGADNSASLLPLYLRDSDAKLPAQPLRLHE